MNHPDGRAPARRFAALLAACLAVLGAVATAAWHVEQQAGFGRGDLPAMLFWSFPLGGLLAIAVRFAPRSLARVHAGWLYPVVGSLGLAIGFGWTVLAGLLLGGSILAFSFPVLLCWMLGGLLGAMAAVWALRPRTWPVALTVALLALSSASWIDQLPEPPSTELRVVMQPGASQADVTEVWEAVLGRRTGRPGRPRESRLLDGIDWVSAHPSRDGSVVIAVGLEDGVSARERDRLVALIQRSLLIAEVEVVTVPGGARPGRRREGAP